MTSKAEARRPRGPAGFVQDDRSAIRTGLTLLVGPLLGALGCFNVNPYATPRSLETWAGEVVVVGPGGRLAEGERAVPGAPRKLRDESKEVLLLPTGLQARLGLGRGWEGGAHMESHGVGGSVKRELARGAVPMAVRVGGTPLVNYDTSPRSAFGQWIGAMTLAKGTVQPVVSLGAAWVEDTRDRTVLGNSQLPAGVLATTSLGLSVALGGRNRVHPEIGLYRAVRERTHGMVFGVGWAFGGLLGDP